MKIAIVGYGNLGRGCELALKHFPDMTCAGVFTRRQGSVETFGAPTFPLSSLEEKCVEYDVLVLAGSSKDDLPALVKAFAARCDLVDSFDRHAEIPSHRKMAVNLAKRGKHAAVLSAGWDPGLFSLARIYAAGLMPSAVCNTVWGIGVSEGHSAAVRRLPGVRYAKAYTVPRPAALPLALAGVRLLPAERHKREVFVVAEPGREEEIAHAIRTMPLYFADDETDVTFLSEEAFRKDHGGHPHKGNVVAVGRSGVYSENRAEARLSLSLDSNPEFTGGILLAAARAAHRLSSEGNYGAFTFADIPPKYFLSPGDKTEKYL